MLKIRIEKKAQQFLRKIPVKHARQLALKITELREDPHPHDSTALKGYPFRRVDSGEYRIVYMAEKTTLWITVIGKRNDDEVYLQSGILCTMILSPLRGRKLVERVRRKGSKWRGKHMQVTYEMSSLRVTSGRSVACYAPAGMQIGTAASTKLHKSAVKRNRMRRRCREALRTCAKEHKKLPNCQLILVPRSSSLEASFAELRQDAEALFDHLSQHARSKET